MAKQDRHLTTEQLSALLDNTLSSQERSSYEAHLQTCVQCQQTLAELRQTVAFLHALPEPALPRSFVLSPNMLAEVSQQRHRAANPVLPFPAPEARKRNKPGYIYNTMRFVSTIAALIGIVILVGSLFSTLPRASFGGTAAPSSASSNSQSKGQALPAHTNDTTSNNGATPGMYTPNVVQTPASVSSAQTSDGQTHPSLPSMQTVLPNLNTPSGFALLGIILLVFGILGLLVLRRFK